MSVTRMIRTGFLVACGMVLSSCSIIRGYRADGLDGPDIFSFEHHVHDTIVNGKQVFRFQAAESRADWIDTLHFYNQPPHCVNMTFAEALNGKSQTQGVMIIQDDKIVYEKYWGDFSADRMATIFSVSKSITSLLCGIAMDEGYIQSIEGGERHRKTELRTQSDEADPWFEVPL